MQLLVQACKDHMIKSTPSQKTFPHTPLSIYSSNLNIYARCMSGQFNICVITRHSQSDQRSNAPFCENFVQSVLHKISHHIPSTTRRHFRPCNALMNCLYAPYHFCKFIALVLNHPVFIHMCMIFECSTQPSALPLHQIIFWVHVPILANHV